MINNDMANFNTVAKAYRPTGSDVTLSREISEFMYSLFAADSDYTPLELGYLGCSAVWENGKNKIELFFEPKMCGEVKIDPRTRKRKFIPHSSLTCLEQWFFVGSLADACSIDVRVMRKHRIVERETHGIVRKSIEYIKEKRSSDTRPVYKMDKECETLVIRCNVDMVIAAINDRDLADPTIRITCGRVAKVPKASQNVIVRATENSAYPIKIEMTYTANSEYNGFNPDSAVPYLTSKRDRLLTAASTERALHNASDKNPRSTTHRNKTKGGNVDYRKLL